MKRCSPHLSEDLRPHDVFFPGCDGMGGMGYPGWLSSSSSSRPGLGPRARATGPRAQGHRAQGHRDQGHRAQRHRARATGPRATGPRATGPRATGPRARAQARAQGQGPGPGPRARAQGHRAQGHRARGPPRMWEKAPPPLNLGFGEVFEINSSRWGRIWEFKG